MAINVIVASTRDKVFQSMESALDVLEGIEKLRNSYNKLTEDFEKSLERKRKKLFEISGLSANAKIISAVR